MKGHFTSSLHLQVSMSPFTTHLRCTEPFSTPPKSRFGQDPIEIHLFSVSAAILFFTTFCFGAGLMSIALDLSPDHQLPNFLSSALHPPPLLPPLACSKCKKANCIIHLHGEPWSGYLIPEEIDQALQEVIHSPSCIEHISNPNHT